LKKALPYSPTYADPVQTTPYKVAATNDFEVSLSKVDIAFKYRTFFLDDDKELEHIRGFQEEAEWCNKPTLKVAVTVAPPAGK
ncbi:hypothetical protein Tco_1444635, partial [Tanacetum coccineum]